MKSLMLGIFNAKFEFSNFIERANKKVKYTNEAAVYVLSGRNTDSNINYSILKSMEVLLLDNPNLFTICTDPKDILMHAQSPKVIFYYMHGCLQDDTYMSLQLQIERSMKVPETIW